MINIDPAVSTLGYAPNVDIRDTIDYHRVMEEYKLGPNGGILTSLNLFTTKFDQVLQLVDKRAQELDYMVLDTPGQIEIFTWSARLHHHRCAGDVDAHGARVRRRYPAYDGTSHVHEQYVVRVQHSVQGPSAIRDCV